MNNVGIVMLLHMRETPSWNLADALKTEKDVRVSMFNVKITDIGINLPSDINDLVKELRKTVKIVIPCIDIINNQGYADSIIFKYIGKIKQINHEPTIKCITFDVENYKIIKYKKVERIFKRVYFFRDDTTGEVDYHDLQNLTKMDVTAFSDRPVEWVPGEFVRLMTENNWMKLCDYCFSDLITYKSDFHVCETCHRIDRTKIDIQKHMLRFQKEWLAALKALGYLDIQDEDRLLYASQVQELYKMLQSSGYYVYASHGDTMFIVKNKDQIKLMEMIKDHHNTTDMIKTWVQEQHDPAGFTLF